MIPILYEKTETNFSSNGLGRLRDCISCIVTEERNGIYECDFEYPITGANYDKITLGRIIGVTHEESDDIQPFDIVSYSRPINGVVAFHSVHISYRQSKMVTYASNVNSLADAFDTFDTVFFPDNPLGQDAGGNPFTYMTDKFSTGYCSAFDGTPKTIRSLLGGVEGSILDTYGGEYEWDKWFVRLHSARGEQQNFSIRYGVNMTDFKDDTDYSESFNSCVPFWTKDDVTVIGNEVLSGQSTAGAGDKCVPLDLSDKFEEQPTTAQLQAMASDIMNSSRSYLPSQSITVNFVRLQDEAGSSQFDALMSCKLCDSVKVIFPQYDLSAFYKIAKTIWNVLLDRYNEMELGNLSTTLSEALGVSSGGGGSYVGGGGGGGATTLGELNDVTISNPTNNQALIYDSSSARWKNGTNPSSGLPLSGGTMTGQIKTSFNSSVAMGSYGASATTVPDLVDEVRLSSGCAGSANIGTAYTKDGVTIATGWYNFLYMPHRSGGVNGAEIGDNCKYGNLMLFGMTASNGGFIIRIASSAIAEVSKIITSTTAKVKTTFTPTSGSSYSTYGGCYYETYGNMVHVHVGVSGLTANTGTTIFTLPSGVRPSSTIFGHGTGGTATNIGYLEVRTTGVVYVYSNGSTYVGADVTYMV